MLDEKGRLSLLTQTVVTRCAELDEHGEVSMSSTRCSVT